MVQGFEVEDVDERAGFSGKFFIIISVKPITHIFIWYKIHLIPVFCMK